MTSGHCCVIVQRAWSDVAEQRSQNYSGFVVELLTWLDYLLNIYSVIGYNELWWKRPVRWLEILQYAL
jgi:hypothetical protein